MRLFLRHLIAAVLIIAAADHANAQQEFEGWDLEPGIREAHLVMVARVTSISRVAVVEGAKTDIALREFRFQPVRVLKGLFQRDTLSMTASDLGLPSQNTSSAPPLKEGEFRLLILAQPRGLNTYGCVSAAPGAKTFGERVPLLAAVDDPLVGVVETLIRVVDARSRQERATLLIDRLRELREHGIATVPLLTSLKTRADWAAEDGRLYAPVADSQAGERAPDAITRLIRRQEPQVRSASIELLRDMLASGLIPTSRPQIESVAKTLRDVLESDEGRTDVRLAALEALDHLLSRNLLARDVKLAAATELLGDQLTGAATYVERAAAVGAFSRAPQSQTQNDLLTALKRLPLDELPAREEVYLQAALRSSPAEADHLIRDRVQRSLAAKQSIESEVEALLVTRNPESMPVLLNAARQINGALRDRQAMAKAFGALADDRAVPVLAYWVRVDGSQLGAAALSALEQIDSDAAAREVRPSLKTEPQLAVKLRMARLLARHAIDDGYALATEHLADTDFTASAALVLTALDDPRTATDLHAILKGHPDRRWQAAALTGLVAVGDEQGRKQVLEILNDERHPLVVDAAQATGLSNDPDLLPPLAKLVQSRNPQIAMASLVALRRFLSGVRTSPIGLNAVLDPDQPSKVLPPEVPQATREVLAEAVASLAVDPYAVQNLRQEAFAVAQLLGGDRHEAMLTDLADQAELEGTPLLKEVQKARKERRDMQEMLMSC